MSTIEDMRIVLRAVATLQGTRRALRRSAKGSDEHGRLLSAVQAMDDQLDDALDAISDQIMEHANDG